MQTPPHDTTSSQSQGRKFVRVKQEGCHVAWADMGGDHGSPIACCSRTDPHDPEAWDAGGWVVTVMLWCV